MLSDLILRLRAFFKRSAIEHEIDDELRFHVDHQVEAYVKVGISRDEARRRAQLEFGGLEQVKEEYRDTLGVRLLDDLLRDLRCAVRALRRSPVFAATAILSIALGVGANALVFSVVNGLVLKPLPISHPDRVVFVQRIGPFVSHSFPVYRDLLDRNVTFEGLAGYRITMMGVDANGSTTHEWGYLATGDYFDLLGVTPVVGQFFHHADDAEPGGSPYAVLSYDYWRTRFGGSPSVVGSTIRVNRIPFTVLGVAPAGFYGTEVFYRPNIWVPMAMQAQIEVGNPWLENRNTANTWVIGRLKPDVSVRQAEANLNAILQQLAWEYPSSLGKDPGIKLARPGLVGDAVGGPARAFAFGVLALAGLVLLTTCVNLASTLAARGTDRQRELAIRLSMGAGRARIVRQLLTETVVLAAIGGAVGALGTVIAARLLSSWQLPIAVPIQLDVRPDQRVFAFAFLVSLVAGVAFGVAPALQAAATDPNAALKLVDGARRRRWPIRDVLVAAQVTLCFVLVAACLTSLRGLKSALAMPLGMEPSGITMASFDIGLAGYSQDAGEALRRRALEAISALPRVQSAAYANSLPLNIDQSSTHVYPDDWVDLQHSEVPRAIKYQVSPGFFRTLGIRMLQGRDVDWRDTSTSRRVAVVNEAFARQILRARDVVGRHFRYGSQGPPIEIVGVVETGKYQSLTERETAVVFEPILQAYNTTTVMLVRSSWPTGEMAQDIRHLINSLDRSLPLFADRSVEEMLGFALLPMRVAAVALSAFGLIAVMLAATGIHGLVSYSVARRRREIAIRVAVGATRRSILHLVLRRIAMLVAGGALLGLPLAVAAGGFLGGIVYQQSVNNTATLGGVALIVVVVGLLACWLPARRALRLDPASALYIE
jgi:predicted permease